MEIKWRKTNRPKIYPYLLEDYYLEIYVNHVEQITICSVSIEHPKTWNKEVGVYDIDLKKMIIVIKDDSGNNALVKEFVFDFKDLELAQLRITEIIRVAKNKIVSQIDEASKNLPV